MDAEQVDAARIAEAIADGEILRVRYDAGSQAGSVRDILPLSVDARFVRARDETMRPKRFRLSALWLVGAEAEVTYVPRRVQRVEVDPQALTAGWAFAVRMPAFAPAFDIALTPRTKTDIHTGKKWKVMRWTQGSPPEYEFDVGDVFHYPAAVAEGGEWGSWPQIVSLQVKDSDANGVSVRRTVTVYGKSAAKALIWRATYEEFLGLLREGPASPQWETLIVPARTISGS